MVVDLKGKVSLEFYKFFKKLECISVLKLRCISDTAVWVSVDGNIKIYNMEDIMESSELQSIVIYFKDLGVAIDDFIVECMGDSLSMIKVNIRDYGYFVFNTDTDKIELHLSSKEEYTSLSESIKSRVKSTFLYSRGIGGWVSRAKFPNISRAKSLARELGLVDKGRVGSNASFEDKITAKAERAENRADRYDYKSDKAREKGDSLQKPIHSMHGDNSFFTQPNINTSSGRAFTRRREKMFEAYYRGFEEFKKSEYYAEKAEAARATASSAKPTDKSFCVRRIREAEKTIRDQKKNIESYEERLNLIRQGKVLKRYNGEVIHESDVLGWIENAEYAIEQAISKSVYYNECLEELGGVEYSKETLKVGYLIKHRRWNTCKVIGVGPKNFKYVIEEGGAKGMGGSSPYTDVVEVLSTDISNKEVHTFKVGDVFTVKQYENGDFVNKEYKVVKISEDRVSFKCGNERAIVRKPMKVFNSNSWSCRIADNLEGTVYKSE